MTRLYNLNINNTTLPTFDDVKRKHENGGILKAQNSAKLPSGYAQYNGSDLSDIETFNKNWLNYRNSQLARQGLKDENIKNKLNWFQRNFGTSDKTVANLVREQLFSNLDNTKELSFSDALKDSQGRYLLTESMYVDFPGERKLYEVEVGPPKPVEDWKLDYSFNGSVGGTHYPDFNTIIYNDSHQNTHVKIHERDHAMFGQYDDKNIGLKIVDNIFKHEFLDDNVVDKWGYYDDPGEIRARLMEMRFDNKLDPTHIYTEEEIKSMRNDPNFKDHHIFDRYSDKYIEYLLNTVAQNTTDPNHIDYRNPITFAKKGGSIHIKKKNRGKFTEYCGGKVTEECIAKGKKSKNPKIRKRATFAANARKWKHENGGVLKAQEGAKNPYAPDALSPIGIALNQAKAMAKMKGEQPKQPQQQYLPPGVKETIGPDGKKVAIKIEQPLIPLEQDVAEVLPGTGDVAEVGYIANDLKNGNLGSAALAAGLMIVPGNIGKWFRKKKSPVVSPKYSSHFTEFLNKNRLSDDFTIKDIDDYIDQLDSNNPSENAMIRNWKNHKSFLITDDTYHKALTPQQIAEEFPKMAVMGEPYVNDAQKELVSRYYAEQKFPRLIENFRKSGMNIEEGDFRYLKDLYSKPFDYVTVMTDYMPPGYGGFYDPYFEKIFVPENASITTLSHETHHALRDKLYDILKRYYKEVPNLPEGLGNTSKGEIYNSMDSRQFLPNEIELMEPLGMSKRYTGDKSPIKEIAAPVSGEIGLKKWMEFHDTYGRYPSPSELDDFIDKTLTMSQARNIGYGYQIGSKVVEEKGTPDHKLLEYYKNAAKYLGAGVGAFAVSKRLNSNNQENEPIN